jgi:hypothetical protein
MNLLGSYIVKYSEKLRPAEFQFYLFISGKNRFYDVNIK